jgi:DNA modification methylase
MPESMSDRFSTKYEYILFFVKNEKYYFDLNSIRDKQKPDGRKDTIFKGSAKYANSTDNKCQTFHAQGHERWNPNGKNPGDVADFWDKTDYVKNGTARTPRKNDGTGFGTDGGGIKTHSGNSLNNPDGKNPGDVADFWDIPTKPNSDNHYAVYNDVLISKPILAGCPVGGIILDPFAGTGTTLQRAIQLGRNAIGFEGKPEYVEKANKLIEIAVSEKQLF